MLCNYSKKSLLYIDNKIHGAIDQLVRYYIDGVFDIQKHEVLFKFYPESFFYYKSTLDKYGIKYKLFRKYSSIDLSTYNIIYYLFNAQSNCRMVSYRNAKHIFVTHGESNKLSSVKPILRIYDYVITAGNAGIDRYLESKIFNRCDIANGKLVMMGDTFIGQAKYHAMKNISKSSILYAPTWEGGVKDENYTSIEQNLNAFKYIIDYSSNYKIDKIVIQPHPNLGHRDKKYKKYFSDGIKLLLQNKKQVILKNYNFSILEKIKFIPYKNLLFFDANSKNEIFSAFVDISAMEVQLINKSIPTYVFINGMKNSIPKAMIEYYSHIGIYDFTKPKYEYDLFKIEEVKNYCISYSDEKLRTQKFSDRLDWLENYAIKDD